MNRTRIRESFSRMSDGDFDIKTMGILRALENNIYFPNAPVQPLQDLINNYRDALKAAGNNGRAEIAEKNKVKQILIEKLRQLAAYVTLTAGGDRTMLLTSGFDLARTGAAKVTVDVPGDLRVENGLNSGEMIVKVKSDRRIRSYNHEYTTDPLVETNTWITAPSTRSRHVFKGLQQGRKYWFRTIAVGANGQIACSKQVSCIVL